MTAARTTSKSKIPVSDLPPKPAKRRNAVTASSLRELRLKKPRPGEEGNSLVRQAVDALRRRILATTEDNRFLGSEDQLLTALGVSRPTFRQAARLLEHEQLLKIKRGIGGGFFAQPPSAEAVSRLASIFLNSQGTTLRQLHDATAPMLMEAARMLAKNPDAKARRALQEFLHSHAGFDEKASGEARLKVRVLLEFEQLVGKLSGNPAVELMINVMRDLVRDPRYSTFQIDDARIAVYASFARRLTQAVIDGDGELAMLIVKRHTKEVRTWIPDGAAPSD
ncbi:MAG: transcriptional regulator [Hydrocarboniphaga sp.]|uniref:FadR/GntR family transcriptional regulator n=1 Tax=Hydrocarboniphaga sp. TaxID=2033016 RepID=UPI002626FDB9|nr:FCD domain-containing protein [Hydrocarboniphaga sp.]MDB5969893.1 transcriptional regulator [Hydrocarboniphaga sp.]